MLIETFQIPGDALYKISNGADDATTPPYSIWRGDSGISGNIATLDYARKLIHDYATNQLRVQIDGLRRRIKDAERSQKILGSDPFNLGTFRVLGSLDQILTEDER